MFGLNWIDVIIVVLLIGAVIEGVRIGLAVQLCSIAGFFAGLIIAGWLFPHLLRPIHDRTLMTIVNVNLVLIVAFYAGIRGFDLGHKLHYSAKKGTAHVVESGFGALLSVVAVLLLSWLLCTTIGRLPFEGFSNSTDDALIIQKLNSNLPPTPAIFAEFNRLVDPNSAPYLFEQSKQRTIIPHSQVDFEKAAAKAENSLVKVTSFSCGSIVSGSGFAVAPNLVATNAHVIAGVKRPIIKYNQRSYEAVPVLFDANLDLAILRVKGLEAPTINLADQEINVNTTVAVLGYPNGNSSASPGVVRNNLYLFGRNIYDLGVIKRNIYEVQTVVGQGSSGGPIVLPDGQVAGIIFAKSNDVEGYGYALASPSLINSAHKAEQSTRRISTGTCLAD